MRGALRLKPRQCNQPRSDTGGTKPPRVTSWKSLLGEGGESGDGMASLTCGDIGLFTGPHQISFSDPSSFTMRLSRGERPVFDPE